MLFSTCFENVTRGVKYAYSIKDRFLNYSNFRFKTFAFDECLIKYKLLYF